MEGKARRGMSQVSVPPPQQQQNVVGQQDMTQQQQQQPQGMVGMAPQQMMAPPSFLAQQQQQEVGGGGSGGAAGFHSASLYVGDLALDVTEAQLYELFVVIGPVASIRVCRDAVTRRSLGYAYVNFNSQADAERALDSMNFTLIKGVPCRMMWSHRDPSLRKTGAGNVFVKNLDPSIDNKNLYDTFSLFGDILSCKVVVGRDGQSKGYGFVHFETTEAADEAIAKINGMLIAGREVYVGKFVKMSERPGALEWTNVYVKNIPVHWTNQRLEDEFGTCGMISSATVMTDDQGHNKGFGFVDFVEHESAVKAVQTLNEKVVLTKLGEETGPEESEEDDKDKAAPSSSPKAATAGESASTNVAPQSSSDSVAPSTSGAAVDSTASTAGSSANSSSSTASSGAGGSAAAKKEDDDEYYFEKAPPAEDSTKRKPTKTQILYVTRAQKKSERERELTQKFEALKQERHNKYQGINLFVKNLSEDVDDEALRREFAPFGTITSARVMRDVGDKAAAVTDADGKVTYPSKGFGFVCYSSPEEATKAVTEMNGKMILGKPVYVALAQRKDQRRAQLEAHHGSRGPRGGLSAGMQPPIYPGAPMFFQPGMTAAPLQMPGAMRGMGGLAYAFPQAAMNMAALQQNGGGRGVQGVGVPGMGMMPRGMLPTYVGGVGGRPAGAGGMAFPPNMMYAQPGVPGVSGMGGLGMPGPGGVAGRARRTNPAGRTGGAAGRPGRVPGQMVGMPMGMAMAPMGGAGGAGLGPNKGFPGQQVMGGPEPLTAAALANATDEQQKNMIGERLYPLIQSVQPQLAGKITGMLLEMDNPELLNLIESPEALNDKIVEALGVLEAHQVQVEGGDEQ